MSTIQRILIYDDNTEYCESLRLLLKEKIPCVETDIALCQEDALECLSKKRYNCLFLDIELENDKSGIEFAEKINPGGRDMQLVFVTAHISYCQDIFDASPDAFLLKPFSAEQISRVLQILHKKSQKKYLVLSEGKCRMQKIPASDISYIEHIGRRLCVFDKNFEKIESIRDVKLSEIEKQQLPGFVRCHSSIYVNLEYTARLDRYQFTMTDGSVLPISQSRFKAVREAFFSYLGESIQQ